MLEELTLFMLEYLSLLVSIIQMSQALCKVVNGFEAFSTSYIESNLN